MCRIVEFAVMVIGLEIRFGKYMVEVIREVFFGGSFYLEF